PIPAQPWDDCFDEVRWPVTLLWPDALRLDVTGSTRYAVVYTEQAEAVCVEPQTGPPDALTLDPVVVTPDEPLSATMAWAWQPD
ncbi:MAG: aldose 1-epimerase, partial [Actinobacteria bacterium]|nr:aldose 1-epimerase [Actinomycetota bacterium]NIS36952.1 aldose 1-epimerase [Actinomycetota bacterium]NIU71422.1 aldose 1-epimerase [Actinomycetota bacterium]NIW33373.1 aldose 1-epimerase [Actinomycetota bacterium]NIX25480.1 aldose 1-epimerase [Actinomycetota bacterium]